jgi:uncharacterized protein YodC (DUF2158 family)
MADNVFSEGDEVQHRTGKIRMIYIGEDTMGDALCEWTDPSGAPRRATFAYTALKKYEKPASGTISLGRA